MAKAKTAKKPAAKAKAKARAKPKAKAKAKPEAKPKPKKPAAAPAAEVDSPEVDPKPFLPGVIVPHTGGTYSVVYSSFPGGPALEAVYNERGLEGGGYTWNGFVVHLLQEQAPGALDAIDFDCESSMFCAVSKDLNALRAVGSALAQLENVELVTKLAKTVDVSDYD